MSPCAKRTRVFRRTGDEVRRSRGRAVKDDRRRRAPVCTSAKRAEDWEEAAGGRVAPILDGPGDVPPKSGSCEEQCFSHRRCQSEAEGRRTMRAEGATASEGPERKGSPGARGRRRRGAMTLKDLKEQEIPVLDQLLHNCHVCLLSTCRSAGSDTQSEISDRDRITAEQDSPMSDAFRGHGM